MDGSTLAASGPAEKLEGLTLDNEWSVVQRLRRHSGGTGHSRSSCYVGHDTKGDKVFIKAYDFRHQEIHGELKDLDWMVREFLNEAGVHGYCAEKKFNRTTRFLRQGKIVVDGEPVHFLVCEYADGSVRDLKLCPDATFPLYERLEIIRDVASAIQELHTNGIAHQDIKPSNTVLFKNNRLKVTDLGSASCLHFDAAPHDSMPCVGEFTYAPYERLYGADGSWYQKKIGCDIFLLGNFAFTLLVGIPFVPIVLNGLDESLRPFNFGGPYRDVLPDIVSTHDLIIKEFLTALIPEQLRGRLVKAILEMCNPDPEKRGHPKSLFNTDSQYSLHRYVSLFNHLSNESKRLRLELM